MPRADRPCQPNLCDRVDRCRRAIARALWPSSCVLCGGAGDEDIDLCSGCAADLPRNDPACTICAEPLAAAGAGSRICGACLHDPPPICRSLVPFRYAWPLDHLVRGLKFRNELACGRVLGELLGKFALARGEPLPQGVLPVPLAPQRYRQRGYNQSHELAIAVRRLTGVPVMSDIAIRQRDTAEQAGLDRNARSRNVHGAFAVVRPLRARRVAILDDVVTTGSTVRELATALRQAGAEQIEVWAIARTQLTA